MKTIVAAIDFSDVTDSIVAAVTEFASVLGGKVVLFHVAPASEPWTDTAFDRYSVGAPINPQWAELEARHREEMLSNIRARMEGARLDVSVKLSRGNTAREVCDELDALHPDFIVMGSHRHGLFHDMLLGGVCPRIVRRASCPVLVVHPGDPVPHRVAA